MRELRPVGVIINHGVADMFLQQFPPYLRLFGELTPLQSPTCRMNYGVGFDVIAERAVNRHYLYPLGHVAGVNSGWQAKPAAYPSPVSETIAGAVLAANGRTKIEYMPTWPFSPPHRKSCPLRNPHHTTHLQTNTHLYPDASTGRNRIGCTAPPPPRQPKARALLPDSALAIY